MQKTDCGSACFGGGEMLGPGDTNHETLENKFVGNPQPIDFPNLNLQLAKKLWAKLFSVICRKDLDSASLNMHMD